MGQDTRTDSRSILATFTSATESKGSENPAQFKNVVGNSSRIKMTHKLAPTLISVPNMFDNVTQYNNTFRAYVGAYGQLILTIPTGFYTVDQLCEALTATFAVYYDIAWTFDPALERIVVTNNDLSEQIVVYSQDENYYGFADLCGFDKDNQIVIDPLETKSLPFPPNLAGPVVVHVECSELAGSNHVHYDGSTQNILCTISMANTPRGNYVMKEFSDLFLHDVDYPYPLHISDLRINLLDDRMRLLTLPPNYNVHVQSKIFYTHL